MSSNTAVVERECADMVSEEKSLDFKRYPLEPEAWDHYNDPCFQVGQCSSVKGLTIRQFMPMKWVSMLAEALRRQLTIEELDFLVHEGEEEVECSACKEAGGENYRFQAVEFVNVPAVLREHRDCRKIFSLEERIPRLGSFLTVGVKSLGFCGAPFWFNPKVFGNDGYEFMAPNKYSHLSQAYLSEANRDSENKCPRPMRTKAVSENLANKIAFAINRQNQVRVTVEKRRDDSAAAVSKALNSAMDATKASEWRPPAVNRRNGIHGGCRQGERR